MRKFLCVLLAIALVSSFAVPCFAATTDDNTIMPRYAYFELLAVDLSIDESTGISRSIATCYALSGYTVEVVCKLQRERTNGWTTLKTWTATGDRYAKAKYYDYT